MTLLSLYKNGYYVGKYISLEKLIEQTKDSYYEALEESSKGWHEEKNDYEPFVKYLLGIVIASSALNEWIFNKDTIREVLRILMEYGIKIDYGAKLGKTIIFAKNQKPAEKILDIFYEEHPHLPGYAKVIDNYMTYAQSAIDEFSELYKLPQYSISVDMLDTGIDVPEILNLVFFKKVMSKAKFWQMIGRGTRLCPGLVD